MQSDFAQINSCFNSAVCTYYGSTFYYSNMLAVKEQRKTTINSTNGTNLLLIGTFFIVIDVIEIICASTNYFYYIYIKISSICNQLPVNKSL